MISVSSLVATTVARVDFTASYHCRIMLVCVCLVDSDHTDVHPLLLGLLQLLDVMTEL